MFELFSALGGKIHGFNINYNFNYIFWFILYELGKNSSISVFLRGFRVSVEYCQKLFLL